MRVVAKYSRPSVVAAVLNIIDKDGSILGLDKLQFAGEAGAPRSLTSATYLDDSSSLDVDLQGESAAFFVVWGARPLWLHRFSFHTECGWY
jgi:hypothetical protein